ncbi:MAG: glycosyltransferase family 39 protein [Deltaproteobacteria bacterium]|nr:glycosyltransferase family 39 protein [Deltaproteobacteria bacterium]
MSGGSPASSTGGRSRLATCLLLFAGTLLVQGATLGARDVWGEECFLLHEGPLEVLASMFAMDRWAGRPPLFWVVRGMFTEVLGPTTWALRLPALLFGAAAAPATWLLARRLLSERSAMLAAVVLTLGALPGYFARESHAYSLSILVMVGLAWVAVELAEGTSPGGLPPRFGAKGRRLGSVAGLLTWTALATSIPLWPVAGLVSLGGLVALRSHRSAQVRFALGQGVAWLLATSAFGAAWLQLRARGGGLLDMGGGDGGGSFDDNDILPTLARAVDGLVFGHHGPLLQTPLAWVLPLATSVALLALLRRGRGTAVLGALAVGGFLGMLAPFWLLSAQFGHDHRLDPRYFVHLAPLVAIAWAAAIESLPRTARGIGALCLLVVVLWGTLRAQLPPNNALERAAAYVAAESKPDDVGLGPASYFAPSQCLTPLPVPWHDATWGSPDPEVGVWVVTEKNEQDRLESSASYEALASTLVSERLVRPAPHEEFGQVVVLTHARTGEPHDRSVGRLWVEGGAGIVALYAVDEYPLRELAGNVRSVGRLPLQPDEDGRPTVAFDNLDPSQAYIATLAAPGVLPIFGFWPRHVVLGTLERSSSAGLTPTPMPFEARPRPAHAMLLALLLVCPLLVVGSLRTLRRPRYQSDERNSDSMMGSAPPRPGQTGRAK